MGLLLEGSERVFICMLSLYQPHKTSNMVVLKHHSVFLFKGREHTLQIITKLQQWLEFWRQSRWL